MDKQRIRQITIGLKKVVAGGLAVAMCFAGYSPVVCASGQPDLSETAHGEISLFNVQIPQEIGNIKEKFEGPEGKVVFIIQDAHAVPEAQHSIEKLIEFSEKEYGIDMVALEGAASGLDSQIFKSFPDKRILKKVFRDYAERGELTGTAAAAIFSQTPAKYYGIENWDLYQEGLGYFQAAMQMEKEAASQLTEMFSELQGEKHKTYSEELFQVDQALRAFHQNASDLVVILEKLAMIEPPQKDSELALLLAEAGHSKENNAAIETEVRQIASQIKTALVQRQNSSEFAEDLKGLNGKLQEFQTSQISADALALFLKELSLKDRIRVRVSEKLNVRTGHQKRMRDIEGTRFFDEFENYAGQVKESLFRSREERNLDFKNHVLELLERLAALKLSRKDWAEIKNLLIKMDAWDLAQDGLDRRGDIARLLRQMQSHIEFYRNAEKRDHVFIQKAQKLFKDHQTRALTLVAGGFHAEGVTELLRAAGISYVLMMPAIKSLPDENHYHDHMRGEVTWGDYFQVRAGKVNLYDAFVRGTRDRLLGISDKRKAFSEKEHLPLIADRLTLKSWRDQIIRDLAEENRLDQAKDYTRFIDELVSRNPDHENTNPVIAQWRANVEKFITGLRQLQSTHQLSEQNIAGLLPSATIGDAPTYAGLAAKTELRADLIPGLGIDTGGSVIETPAAKPELRVEIDNDPNLSQVVDAALILREQMEDFGFEGGHPVYDLLNDIYEIFIEFDTAQIEEGHLHNFVLNQYSRFQDVKPIFEALARQEKISSEAMDDLYDALALLRVSTTPQRGELRQKILFPEDNPPLSEEELARLKDALGRIAEAVIDSEVEDLVEVASILNVEIEGFEPSRLQANIDDPFFRQEMIKDGIFDSAKDGYAMGMLYDSGPENGVSDAIHEIMNLVWFTDVSRTQYRAPQERDEILNWIRAVRIERHTEMRSADENPYESPTETSESSEGWDAVEFTGIRDPEVRRRELFRLVSQNTQSAVLKIPSREAAMKPKEVHAIAEVISLLTDRRFLHRDTNRDQFKEQAGRLLKRITPNSSEAAQKIKAILMTDIMPFYPGKGANWTADQWAYLKALEKESDIMNLTTGGLLWSNLLYGFAYLPLLAITASFVFYNIAQTEFSRLSTQQQNFAMWLYGSAGLAVVIFALFAVRQFYSSLRMFFREAQVIADYKTQLETSPQRPEVRVRVFKWNDQYDVHFRILKDNASFADGKIGIEALDTVEINLRRFFDQTGEPEIRRIAQGPGSDLIDGRKINFSKAKDQKWDHDVIRFTIADEIEGTLFMPYNEPRRFGQRDELRTQGQEDFRPQWKESLDDYLLRVFGNTQPFTIVDLGAGRPEAQTRELEILIANIGQKFPIKEAYAVDTAGMTRLEVQGNKIVARTFFSRNFRHPTVLHNFFNIDLQRLAEQFLPSETGVQLPPSLAGQVQWVMMNAPYRRNFHKYMKELEQIIDPGQSLITLRFDSADKPGQVHPAFQNLTQDGFQVFLVDQQMIPRGYPDPREPQPESLHIALRRSEQRMQTEEFSGTFTTMAGVEHWIEGPLHRWFDAGELQQVVINDFGHREIWVSQFSNRETAWRVVSQAMGAFIEQQRDAGASLSLSYSFPLETGILQIARDFTPALELQTIAPEVVRVLSPKYTGEPVSSEKAAQIYTLATTDLEGLIQAIETALEQRIAKLQAQGLVESDGTLALRGAIDLAKQLLTPAAGERFPESISFAVDFRSYPEVTSFLEQLIREIGEATVSAEILSDEDTHSALSRKITQALRQFIRLKKLSTHDLKQGTVVSEEGLGVITALDKAESATSLDTLFQGLFLNEEGMNIDDPDIRLAGQILYAAVLIKLAIISAQNKNAKISNRADFLKAELIRAIGEAGYPASGDAFSAQRGGLISIMGNVLMNAIVQDMRARAEVRQAA